MTNVGFELMICLVDCMDMDGEEERGAAELKAVTSKS